MNYFQVIIVLFCVISFKGISQIEEGPIEPQYFSKQVVTVKLSDFPKQDLHGLAYEILNYDFTTNGNQILQDIAIESHFLGRKETQNIEVFIPENNVTVVIYSEKLFLENYKALLNESPYLSPTQEH